MTKEKVRIDKWLWAVRIFKSRTLAAETIKSNKVKINDNAAKSSSLVKIGDTVTVKKNGFNFVFKVRDVIEKRVGAPLAVACYQDITPVEELNKFNDWFIGNLKLEFREKGAGRPTKKERREIDDFKDFYFDDEADDDEDDA